MKNLKESLLDTDFDIDTASFLFHNILRLANDNVHVIKAPEKMYNHIWDLLITNMRHMEGVDYMYNCRQVATDPKFKRVANRAKSTEGVEIDLPMYQSDDFVDTIWQLYLDLRAKRIGKLEYKKELEEAAMRVEIYSFGKYFFTYIIDSMEEVYGFVACD